MKAERADIGYFDCGLPYNRFGSGERIMVIFQGLMFENKPMPSFMIKQFSKMYGFLEKYYTTYLVNRAPNMQEGMSMKDISDTYADMIKQEFGGAVDIMGVSTGGSLVQHFAADHPDLVRKLIIHSSAHTLAPGAKRGQLLVAKYARQKKWWRAYLSLMCVTLPERGIKRLLLTPFYGFIALFGGAIFGKPKDNNDVAIMVEAEDKHEFKDRLGEISSPTLVAAGENDPFYTPELFKETAEGIPNARLALYEKMGHPASGEQFQKDVSEFLEI